MDKAAEICKKYGSAFDYPKPGTRIAIALKTLGKIPTYGLREFPMTDDPNEITWFLFCGANTGEDDFFDVMCVEHIAETLPEVMPYLGLECGFRFVIDHEGYEDVYFEAPGIS